MSGKILITGATGNVGCSVINHLVTIGKNIKVAVRNVEKAKKMRWDTNQVEITLFDYYHPSNWGEIFLDVDQLVLIAPLGEAISDQMLNPVINFAKECQIKKIVLISLLRMNNDEYYPLHSIERHLENCGVNYIILQCNWTMQNFMTTFRNNIQVHNMIQAPAGNGKISFIDARDIALFVGEVLQFSQYDKKIFHLSGKESLSFTDIAQIFSQIFLRKIDYIALSEDEARNNLIGLGMSSENIALYLKYYYAIRQGWADVTSYDFLKILLKDPISFKQFVLDYEPIWAESWGNENLGCW